jgi:hypothetical protein
LRRGCLQCHFEWIFCLSRTRWVLMLRSLTNVDVTSFSIITKFSNCSRCVILVSRQQQPTAWDYHHQNHHISNKKICCLFGSQSILGQWAPKVGWDGSCQ